MAETIPKFKVGHVYYADWGGRKHYFLCIKRNDRTNYVSFNPIYNGHRSTSVDSRKIKTGFKWDKSGGKYSEEISIGFGGEGMWRNHLTVRADQEANIKYTER